MCLKVLKSLLKCLKVAKLRPCSVSRKCLVKLGFQKSGALVMLGTSLGWVFGGKVMAQVISVYTGLCWVHFSIESWVVKFWHERSVFTLGFFLGTSLGWVLGGKVLAQVFSAYTGFCWVHILVESWAVKFGHKCSVFTPGCVGYTCGLIPEL